MSQGDPTFDRMLRNLAAIVRGVFPNILFLAKYPCTVQAQNSDGTLELKPDSSLLPTYSNVQYKTGVPGIKLKVAANARCTLYFENGLRVSPRAVLWENPGLVSLDITASSEISLVAQAVNLGANPGSAAVGRVGDAVQVTLSPAAVATIIAPSGGGPCTGGGVPLSGTIQAGSPIVKAS